MKRAGSGSGADPGLYQNVPDSQYVSICSVLDPLHFGVDPDLRNHASDKWIKMLIRILLFSSLTFMTPTKTKIKNFFLLITV
jgi:hypothetical protein